jgi:glycosyltransferase involved in cell wall biosynthesis
VHTAQQAAAAVARIGTIDRAGCRARVEQRFSADRMVEDYLRIYRDLLAGTRG